MLTLNIIGAGRAAQTLAHLWQQAGLLQIQTVLCRQQQHAQQAVELIGAGTATSDLAQSPPADIWLIATPADQIQPVATQLAAMGIHGQSAFHLSGSLTAEHLAPLRACGLALASIHPIRSFAQPQLAISQFAGTCCGSEGDAGALALLLPLFSGIGAQTFTIESQHKSLYHAGSVIACNYLVTLLEAGLQCFEAAGVSREHATTALLPLLHGALNNIGKLGTAQALTGPIVRGDAGVVAKHQTALQQSLPQLLPLYQLLGQHTLQLASTQLSASALQKLAETLTDINKTPRD